ncbi:putative tRNA pseudouridine synthase Pus10 [Coemansia nantahalensis]|nr:putative tRNA pseudouridine synthase Pus10 [Coemansia nantahalensis]
MADVVAAALAASIARPGTAYASIEQAKEAAATLAATGACALCVLRFLRVPLGPAYQDDAAAAIREALGITTSDDPAPVCPACLGTLGPEVARRAAAEFKSQCYDTTAVTVAVELPKSVYVRHRAMQLLCTAAPAAPAIDVKDAVRHVVLQRLAAECDVVAAIDGEMRIEITFSHAETADDHQFLAKRPHGPGAGDTKSAIVAALAACSDDEFRARFPCPPPAPASAAVVSSMVLRRASVFVGGRYLKLERNISQTPFIVEGRRVTEHSVAEIIGEPLMALTRSDSYNLVGSGREDADVRMLGDGRPFYIECINPRTTQVSPAQIEAVEAALRERGSPVQVRRLQMVTAADTSIIKDGEENKSKRYCALVWIARPLTAEQLAEINAIGREGLLLQQKTPVRVLQRRAALTRPRRILALAVEPIAGRFYRAHIESEAGTYIKEFVHGDLGRTVPSLAGLAGATADILELDVENVALDFPPTPTPAPAAAPAAR